MLCLRPTTRVHIHGQLSISFVCNCSCTGMHALAEPPRHNSLQLTTQLHREVLNNRHVCMHVLQSTDLTHSLCHVKASGSEKFGVHCTDLDVNHSCPQQQLSYRHMHMHKLQLLMKCCICIKSLSQGYLGGFCLVICTTFATPTLRSVSCCYVQAAT